jgi:hypothetical protein
MSPGHGKIDAGLPPPGADVAKSAAIILEGYGT